MENNTKSSNGVDVDVKKLPLSEIELSVTISKENFEKFYDGALARVSMAVEVPGFRPGKVPKDMVQDKVGVNEVLDEAARDAVGDTFWKTLEEKNILPINQPKIQILTLSKGSPLTYKAQVSVLPEIKLPDYKKIAQKVLKNKQEVKVEEKEIDETLKYLQSTRASHITVARPAEKGDRVEIDFQAKRNGVVIEGGQSKNHPLIIGQSKFVPGFDDNLIGLKEGEDKIFSLQFPSDYHQKDLAGQNVQFETKMRLVQKVKEPELNDEFAKSMGKFEHLGALRASVQEGIKLEKDKKEKDRARHEAIDMIAKETEMEMPEVLIERELNQMIGEFKNNATNMGLNYEDYLTHLKKTEDELKKGWRGQATERAKVALVLRELALKENIKPDEAEVETEMDKLLKQFKSTNEAEQSFDTEHVRDYTRTILKNEKVFQYLENL
ncbi:MAG: trigger factor [Candidatus Portnoybacteria bacterium CG10_big_fil_rev_8_21_14_0_10_36_7]|uniref:Trigger factor n=1 Tax=Candidatus Portnoybacteria bacterium CG10_big_fil_rev_8_21_14_0_10_36_7 TaxID=1974812 RepID=A0A2M8KEQ5_9BACT|nr:MAG: trigger factor [Candidatus Portnoybacteria bacterium CG10_big_fil_rev_8_21_14_0_10_36_7]